VKKENIWAPALAFVFAWHKIGAVLLQKTGDSNALSLPDRHYQDEIIPLCIRWNLRYALSYRDLQEMIRERGLSIDAMRRFIPTHSLQLNRNSSMLPGWCQDTFEKKALVFAAWAAADFSLAVSTPGSSARIVPVA
jgi:hypothetical protein